MARKQCEVPLRQNYSWDLKRHVIHMSQKLFLAGRASSASEMFEVTADFRLVECLVCIGTATEAGNSSSSEGASIAVGETGSSRAGPITSYNTHFFELNEG
jgi:predicted transcriptional regulator